MAADPQQSTPAASGSEPQAQTGSALVPNQTEMEEGEVEEGEVVESTRPPSPPTTRDASARAEGPSSIAPSPPSFRPLASPFPLPAAFPSPATEEAKAQVSPASPLMVVGPAREAASAPVLTPPARGPPIETPMSSVMVEAKPKNSGMVTEAVTALPTLASPSEAQKSTMTAAPAATTTTPSAAKAEQGDIEMAEVDPALSPIVDTLLALPSLPVKFQAPPVPPTPPKQQQSPPPADIDAGLPSAPTHASSFPAPPPPSVTAPAPTPAPPSAKQLSTAAAAAFFPPPEPAPSAGSFRPAVVPSETDIASILLGLHDSTIVPPSGSSPTSSLLPPAAAPAVAAPHRVPVLPPTSADAGDSEHEAEGSTRSKSSHKKRKRTSSTRPSDGASPSSAMSGSSALAAGTPTHSHGQPAEKKGKPSGGKGKSGSPMGASSAASATSPLTRVGPRDMSHVLDPDSGLIRCICSNTDDDGFTIQCDMCYAWEHAVCMGIREGDVPEEYLCELCSPRPVDVPRARQKQRQRIILEAQKRREEEAAGRNGGGGVSGTGAAGRGITVPQTVESRGVSHLGGQGMSGGGRLDDLSGAGGASSHHSSGHLNIAGGGASSGHHHHHQQSMTPAGSSKSRKKTVGPAGATSSHHQSVSAGAGAGGSSGQTPSTGAKPRRGGGGSLPPSTPSASSNVHSLMVDIPPNNMSYSTPSGGGGSARGGGGGGGAGDSEDEDLRLEAWTLEYTPVKESIVRCPRVKQVIQAVLDEYGAEKPSSEVTEASVTAAVVKSEAGSIDVNMEVTPVVEKVEPPTVPPSLGTRSARNSPAPTPSSLSTLSPLGPFLPPLPLTGPSLSQLAAKILIKPLVSSSQLLLSSSAVANSAPSFTRAVYPRPATYAVYADAAISAGAFIGEYKGEILLGEAYRTNPINQYRFLGVPKSSVRTLGVGLDLCIDARGFGSELRFVRSSCHPNVVLRPATFTRTPAASSTVLPAVAFPLDDDESSTSTVAAGPQLVFGLFASRDISRREEICLPWEWDDAHVVHALAPLLEARLDAQASGALVSNPPGYDATLAVLAPKFEAVLGHFAGTFLSCGCDKKKDCAMAQMARLAEGKTFLGLEKLSSLGGASAGGGGNSGRSGGGGSKRTKRPDLGVLIGATRGWRVKEITRAARLSVAREEAVRLAYEERERKARAKAEALAIAAAAEAEQQRMQLDDADDAAAIAVVDDDVEMADAARQADDDDDMGALSDASTLTEPLSHFSESEEDERQERRGDVTADSDAESTDLSEPPSSPSSSPAVASSSRPRKASSPPPSKRLKAKATSSGRRRVNNRVVSLSPPSSPSGAAAVSDDGEAVPAPQLSSSLPLNEETDPVPPKPFDPWSAEFDPIPAEEELCRSSGGRTPPFPRTDGTPPPAPSKEPTPPLKEPTPPPKEPTPPPRVPTPPPPPKRLSLKDWAKRKKETPVSAPAPAVIATASSSLAKMAEDVEEGEIGDDTNTSGDAGVTVKLESFSAVPSLSDDLGDRSRVSSPGMPAPAPFPTLLPLPSTANEPWAPSPQPPSPFLAHTQTQVAMKVEPERTPSPPPRLSWATASRAPTATTAMNPAFSAASIVLGGPTDAGHSSLSPLPMAPQTLSSSPPRHPRDMPPTELTDRDRLHLTANFRPKGPRDMGYPQHPPSHNHHPGGSSPPLGPKHYGAPPPLGPSSAFGGGVLPTRPPHGGASSGGRQTSPIQSSTARGGFAHPPPPSRPAALSRTSPAPPPSAISGANRVSLERDLPNYPSDRPPLPDLGGRSSDLRQPHLLPSPAQSRFPVGPSGGGSGGGAGGGGVNGGGSSRLPYAPPMRGGRAGGERGGGGERSGSGGPSGSPSSLPSGPRALSGAPAGPRGFGAFSGGRGGGGLRGGGFRGGRGGGGGAGSGGGGMGGGHRGGRGGR